MLIPRWNGNTWLLGWRHVLNLRMLRLRSDHVGGVDSDDIVLGAVLELSEAFGGRVLDLD